MSSAASRVFEASARLEDSAHGGTAVRKLLLLLLLSKGQVLDRRLPPELLEVHSAAADRVEQALRGRNEELGRQPGDVRLAGRGRGARRAGQVRVHPPGAFQHRPGLVR